MSQKTYKIIDPHLHFFALQDGDYHWLKAENPPFWPNKAKISQTYLEKDLILPAHIALAGFVHIEAGFDNQQPWREIDWLEAHCTKPFSSVAFADITANSFEQDITQLLTRKSVVGIRHILDEQGYDILSAAQTAQNMTLLASQQLSFDAQLQVNDSNTINQLIRLANTIPQLNIIINHCGTPPTLGQNEYVLAWQENILKLAECKNIAIKLSGWEMFNSSWTIDWLDKILIDCFNTFGSERVMLASNFPVCVLTHSYAELWQIYLRLADKLDANCLQKITYDNAKHWYRLAD
ncbi:amidohydrolase [Paraglaciecola sp. L3A3]|uniref:amidohydrolase family protein n=1 Tax=Paraglaciecola sp. L3A3 TaxID=2686358 RepID=UPI00131D99EF|nr:amidohydrolase family protein [Paraglaciecola sp. L3A3]